MKIRVILVDDHAVVRAGFKMLLATHDNIKVIAEADRGEQAIQLYKEKQPDVMVMDISMPGIGGLEAIRRICTRHNKAKILVFSVHQEQAFINQAMSAGARGFISKNSAADILVDALHCIVKGDIYIEQELQQGWIEIHKSEPDRYKAMIENLSPREFDIFLLLVKGKTAHKIADELCLSYKTVANYNTQIKKKLNVSTLAELVHIAVSYGIVDK